MHRMQEDERLHAVVPQVQIPDEADHPRTTQCKSETKRDRGACDRVG